MKGAGFFKMKTPIYMWVFLFVIYIYMCVCVYYYDATNTIAMI